MTYTYLTAAETSESKNKLMVFVANTSDDLLDAGVVLVGRAESAGLWWGDCQRSVWCQGADSLGPSWCWAYIGKMYRG